MGNRWFHAKDFSEVLSKCRRKKFFRLRLGFPKVDGMSITRGFIEVLGGQTTFFLDDERSESLNTAPEHGLMLRGSLPW